jgi:hypothetical protein
MIILGQELEHVLIISRNYLDRKKDSSTQNDSIIPEEVFEDIIIGKILAI